MAKPIIISQVVVTTSDGSSYLASVRPVTIPKAVVVTADGNSFLAELPYQISKSVVVTSDGNSFLASIPKPEVTEVVVPVLRTVIKTTEILLAASLNVATKTTQILLNGDLPRWSKTHQILLNGDIPLVIKETSFLYGDTTFFSKTHDFTWDMDTTVITYPVTSTIVFKYRLRAGNTEITMPTYFGYSILSGRIAYPLRTAGTFIYAMPELVKVTCSTSFAYGDMSIIDKATSFEYADSTIITKATAFSYQGFVITSKAMVFNTSNPTVITKLVAVGFSNPTVIVKSTDFGYAGFSLIVGETSFNYLLKDTVVKDAAFAYELSDKNWVTKETRIGYKLLGDLSSQSIQASPTLYKGDTQLDFIYIDMSSDETSPYWLAEVGLSASATFADLNINDDIEIRFPDTTYKMIVDGKALSRRDNAEAGYVVKMVSPLARLDVPFSDTETVIYTIPKYASEVVAEVLGQDIGWNLPDWMIGVEQLQWVDESPLSIARKIVEAIGGVIESMADGSINCRKKYPVSPLNYDTADHTHLSDSEVFDISETVSATATFNRLDVYNSPIANSGINDSLEYKALDNNDLAGIVHGYPSPYRACDLVHTGNPATTIVDLDDEVRTEVEMVEFIGGKAQTRYPIDSISSITWNVVNLGAVTYSGKNLTSAVLGESLLNITYQVKAKRFDVSGADQTIVQFCLIE